MYRMSNMARVSGVDPKDNPMSGTNDVFAIEPSRRDSQAPSAAVGSLLEALLLFVCLVLVIAVSMSLFGYANVVADNAAKKQKAVTLAENTAERFASDPLSVPSEQISGGLLVRCSVALSADEAGLMFAADIDVLDNENFSGQDVIYSLHTARYMSNGGNSSDTRLMLERNSASKSVYEPEPDVVASESLSEEEGDE